MMTNTRLDDEIVEKRLDDYLPSIFVSAEECQVARRWLHRARIGVDIVRTAEEHSVDPEDVVVSVYALVEMGVLQKRDS